MIRKNDFIKLIRNGSFKELFITELGWNYYKGESRLPLIRVDEVEYQLHTIAQRNGFQILYCEVDELPTQTLAKKIDSKLRRIVNDYICIYRKRSTAHDVWVVPVRNNEKRDLVMVECDQDHIDFLYSKLEGFTFEMDEETNIVDLRAQVQKSFAVNSEKITKDFYAGFKKQHKAFAEFITGIDDHIALKDNANKKWFTSVMLNRLMFCYFIQKKGFLDNDYNYLREKLNWVRQEQGENRFFRTFYKGFLADLFHDGLNSPVRDQAFRNKYGKIPYLNGGMFEEHQIELEYKGIDIEDDAFIQLFDFFDTWRWHLDTRITSTGKDINPDVLGYIFEQYINDRAQMGAYYTKEDITEYIGRNCILPFLFDKVAASSSAPDFKPEGYVWETLKKSGDKYVFDAVKKGYKDFDTIPEEISCGIITPQMHQEYAVTPVGEHNPGHVPLSELRKEWNRPTPETWALPTEIWRETIDRLQRCDANIGKIRNGVITAINDFITYNLDIRSFALNLIEGGDSKFVKNFYKALTQVTILDPTCGSGAFLFAAMNILEPLYEACIERMQSMNSENKHLFKEELEEINGKYRSNIQYFIYKSIILRNLYGVDIMVEATEIAKLRLFLKMVAVVDVDTRADNLGLDPLPDIDFNIRCGNTLVGYANKAELDRDLNMAKDIWEEIANQELKEKIEVEMKTVAATFEVFKKVQLVQDEDIVVFKKAKHELRRRLNILNDTLNHRQHEACKSLVSYEDWLDSHKPFNWLAEFYTIIEGNGGFDVIIGNPPYVEFPSSDVNYYFDSLRSSKCGNLYGCCTERGLSIGNKKGRFSFIIPVAITCSKRMSEVIDLLKLNSELLCFANFDDRPGKLFEMIEHLRASIFISSRGERENTKVFSTKYNRWYTCSRYLLFNILEFVDVSKFVSSFTIPKFSNSLECGINSNLLATNRKIEHFYGIDNNKSIFYRAAGGGYFLLIKVEKSLTYINGILENVKAEKSILLDSKYNNVCVAGLISSSLFYWNYIGLTDCRNLTKSFIDNFACPSTVVTDESIGLIANKYFVDLTINSRKKDTYYRTTNRNVVFWEYYPKLSKKYIDEIDTELAKHYGFSEEELDFIINYDIKYRMGDELNSEG